MSHVLAGIPFEVRCSTHGLQEVDLPGYRTFRGRFSPSLADAPPIFLECRVAVPPGCGEPLPDHFLDGGSWGYYADGDEDVYFAPVPHSGLDVQWCARMLRGGARTISVTCSEALLAPGAGEPRLADPLRYPLDQIVLVRALADRGLLLHAAGAVLDGSSLVFPGVSGAGKTTLSRLLDREGYSLLSDDRVVVRRDENGFTAWGTPWPGEGGYARNEHAPVSAICFLKKDAGCALRPLSRSEALPLLLKVASVPWYDPNAVAGPLQCVAELLERVPVYELAFRPEVSAVRRIAHLIGDSR